MISEQALETTFCLEYSPNCKKKFMVRIVRYRRGCIDKLSPYSISQPTHDAIGYGDTFEKAFNEAFKAREKQRQAL